MYGSSLIMGMLMLCNRYESITYSMWIYRDYYNENVREICSRMIRKEKEEVFDTFDVVELELRMN
ncbi:hypothetical protein ECANGB1_515 [Enterospora canceri]|uniref:Uncharacterized protein n=1 Tax=Enterospora canceri TaxID=1081671 RepID=A0A1Y1S4E3_9MICR|nr:hypothetical protein ECANGB1_515 [Enterospora canceri]